VETATVQQLAIGAVIVGFFGWRKVRFLMAKKTVRELIKAGATVIDVRTREEYASGCSPKSINIPLDEFEQRLSELDRSKPIIVCCRSGARSEVAAGILKKSGFSEVVNAGPWTNVAI
jgi:phage shock protein E